MKRQTALIALCIAFLLFGLSSCAPAGGGSGPYGFLFGFFHGFLIVFEVIAKLLGMPYGLYATNNTGATYWIGYIIGLLGFGGGGLGIFSRR